MSPAYTGKIPDATGFEAKRAWIQQGKPEWERGLTANLLALERLVRTIYEYLIDSPTPDVESLELIRKQLRFMNKVLEQDVFPLESKSNKLVARSQHGERWTIFALEIKGFQNRMFFQVLDALDVYIKLLSAQASIGPTLSQRSRPLQSILKDIEVVSKKHATFRDKLREYSDLYRAILRQLPR